MQNPFSLSFGKTPLSLIDREYQKAEIINSFEGENPATQVYMITGLRGSGKTVMMTDIAKHFRDQKDWIVVDLTPERDLLQSLAASLSNNNELIQIFRDAKLNLSFLGLGIEIDGVPPITDINIAIVQMLEKIKKRRKKLLITIDEAVCNKTMREFTSVFQIYIRQELPVFLLLTGLYENIYELQNEKTLTFLYRAPKLELKPLNIGMIAEKYKEIFDLEEDDSIAMAKETKGYPFAFQVLGYLCWTTKNHWNKVLAEYQQKLEDYVYEKIWSELSAHDKEVLTAMLASEDNKVAAIRNITNMSSNQFSVYRNRLLKKGIIYAPDYGKLDFSLPRFDRFIKTVS